MPVYRLERRQQPRAALPVQAAYRAPQPIYRLVELVALGNAGAVLAFDLGQFGLRDEIDGPEPLALGVEPFEPRRLGCAIGDIAADEADLFG